MLSATAFYPRSKVKPLNICALSLCQPFETNIPDLGRGRGRPQHPQNSPLAPSSRHVSTRVQQDSNTRITPPLEWTHTLSVRQSTSDIRSKYFPYLFNLPAEFQPSKREIGKEGEAAVTHASPVTIWRESLWCRLSLAVIRLQQLFINALCCPLKNLSLYQGGL